MFAEHTVRSIIALACIDKGVTDAEKDALERVLSGEGREQDSVRCVKYATAAEMLGLSVPTIKRLVKSGRLKAVSGTGSIALGVTLESVKRFAS